MSAAFTHLAAPLLEDSMEVSSSPAGNAFDNDIDIDFEDYSGGIHLTDDERMLEDGDPTRPPTATDEMMDDEDHSATVVEEVMQDDHSHEQIAQLEPADEELIDYDDDSYQDVNQSFFDDTTLQNTEISFAAPTETLTEPEVVPEEQAKLEDHAISTADAEVPTLDAPNLEDNHSETQSTTKLPPETAAAANQANEQVEDNQEEQEVTAVDDITYDVVEDLPESKDAAAPQEEEEAVEDVDALKAPPQFPGTLDTTSSAEVPDGPPTPTDTGLLPMIVKYLDYSLPLFKSKNQPDGLLKNDNLASTGLSDLMQDCRRRLHAKVGETEIVPENHHIVLGFDRLGLVLVECDTSAYDVSLNDVIQVWEQLHYNDDLDIPPLSITLTSQPKFSSALGLLQEAANQEQGISSLQGPAISQDVEYVAEEQAVDSTDANGVQLDRAHTDGTGNEEQYDEHAGDYAEDYADVYEEYQQGDGEETQEGEDIIGEQIDEHTTGQHTGDVQPGELDYAEFNEDEEYPDPEDFDQDHEPEGKTEDHGAADDQENTQHTESHEEPAENGEAESAASSITARDDATLDTAGEYDPDLIDWDDDDDDDNSLTRASEANPNQGIDEFANFLYDHEADGAGDGPHDAEYDEAVHNDASNEDAALISTGHFEEETGTDQPNFEEAAKDPTQEQYQDDPDDGLIQYEDDTFNEADYVEHDQNGNELGEDEEQFHTALDALEDEDGDQGQENVADGSEPVDLPQPEVPDEDEIGYEDDFPEPETTADATTNSPLGKRSFEELADEDELDFEEPELKKARSD